MSDMKTAFDSIPLGGATGQMPAFSRSTVDPPATGLLPPTRKPVAVTVPEPAPSLDAAPPPLGNTPPPNAGSLRGFVWDLVRPTRGKLAILAGGVSLVAGAYGLNLIMPGTPTPTKKTDKEKAAEVARLAASGGLPTVGEERKPAPRIGEERDGGLVRTGLIEPAPLPPVPKLPTDLDPLPKPTPLPRDDSKPLPIPAVPNDPLPVPKPPTGGFDPLPVPKPIEVAPLPKPAPIEVAPLPVPKPPAGGDLVTLPKPAPFPVEPDPLPKPAPIEVAPLPKPAPIEAELPKPKPVFTDITPDPKPLPVPKPVEPDPPLPKPKPVFTDITPVPDLPPIGGTLPKKVDPAPLVITPDPTPVLPPPKNLNIDPKPADSFTPVTPKPSPFTIVPDEKTPVVPAGSGLKEVPPAATVSGVTAKRGVEVDVVKVRGTDTYATISESYYQSKKYAAALRAFNGNADIGTLSEVEVPPLHELNKPAREPVGGPVVRGPVTDSPDDNVEWGPAGKKRAVIEYRKFSVVRDGSTPREVAKMLYGDESEWPKLVAPRGQRLRADDPLPRGTELTYPWQDPWR